MQNELEDRIPKKHYKKIEENSRKLSIPTHYQVIIYKYENEFLPKHAQRRKLDPKSAERLKIEDENRAFLEEYCNVYERITYWCGYYLNEGYGGDKNEEKASELFKKAADEGVAGAQLRYAFSLVKHNKINNTNLEEFLNYITKSADNGNYIAQYNLGDVYYDGKLGCEIDKVKGEKYLKLAAKNGYDRAIKLCNEKKIRY